eukprot:499433-Prymnesium_polylepis.1
MTVRAHNPRERNTHTTSPRRPPNRSPRACADPECDEDGRVDQMAPVDYAPPQLKIAVEDAKVEKPSRAPVGSEGSQARRLFAPRSMEACAAQARYGGGRVADSSASRLPQRPTVFVAAARVVRCGCLRHGVPHSNLGAAPQGEPRAVLYGASAQPQCTARSDAAVQAARNRDIRSLHSHVVEDGGREEVSEDRTTPVAPPDYLQAECAQ